MASFNVSILFKTPPKFEVVDVDHFKIDQLLVTRIVETQEIQNNTEADG